MIMNYRKAIESLYKDTCTIIERQSYTDPITKKTAFREVTVNENVPCRLSFGSVPSTVDGSVAEMVQSVTLFVSSMIDVKPGSKIVVTQKIDGKTVTTNYSNSGKPAVHTYHQEVSLKLFERWS